MDIKAVQFQVDRVLLSKRWYTGDLKNAPGVTHLVNKKNRKAMYITSLEYLERILLENWDFNAAYHFAY